MIKSKLKKSLKSGHERLKYPNVYILRIIMYLSMRIVSEPYLHAQNSVNMAPRHFKKLATDGIQYFFSEFSNHKS